MSALVNDIVNYGLVGAIYAACAITAIFMAVFSVRLVQYEQEALVARREQAKKDHIAALERNWPQYVIQETP